MDEPTRRAWSKPELIVIVRSKPGEAVLLGCRQWTSGADRDAIHDACLQLPSPCNYVCANIGASS